jgi:two-component system, OmpR family, phosphate regulon sensor histidine kinase PhoR
MKKKFFIINLLITFIGFLLISVITTTIYYQNTLNNAKTNLAIYMNQYDQNVYTFDDDGANKLSSKLSSKDIITRVTFINLDGVVVGDSSEKSSQNHLDREEVKNSKTSGYAYSIRNSDTIGSVLVYYCMYKKELGYIRLAQPSSSYISTFNRAIPGIVIFLIFDLVISVFLSNYFFKKIISPIKVLADKSKDGVVSTTYPELEPIVESLNSKTIENNKKIEQIKKNKELSDIVLNNMEHGIAILDYNHNIVLINNKAKDLFNVYPNINKVYYLENDKECKKILNLKQNEIINRYFNDLIYEIRFSFLDEAIVILLSDITSMEASRQSKNDFINNVTHEMNTPLTSIKGYAELIENKMLPEDKINHATKVIISEADKLSQLIKSIINYSSFEATNLELYDVNVKDIVNIVISKLTNNAEIKGITIQTNLNDLIVKSRNEYIQEISMNLISNAIKYNKDNGKVYVETNSDSLIVKDTGIGIEKENLEKIFDRFYTVDKSHNKKISGFGLGLAIVKKICKNNNYVISVESKKDKGSTFTVKFK